MKSASPFLRLQLLNHQLPHRPLLSSTVSHTRPSTLTRPPLQQHQQQQQQHHISSTANTMALPPKFSGQLLSLTSSSPSTTSTPHTLELYLDYVCPFSAKQFLTFTSTIAPLIKKSYSNPGFRIIFRQQIQPWHPSSTLVHEAGAAVLRLAPDKFWTFSEELMKRQKEYFDVNVVNETRNQTYKRLADMIESSTGVKAKEAYELLVVSDRPGEDGGLNTGNKVTDDVKFMVKANRLTGVHVTPSVLFNGVLEGGISSSWGEKEWKEWLDKNAK